MSELEKLKIVVAKGMPIYQNWTIPVAKGQKQSTATGIFTLEALLQQRIRSQGKTEALPHTRWQPMLTAPLTTELVPT
jgi:tellurite resistance-related uncharacterized protein